MKFAYFSLSAAFALITDVFAFPNPGTTTPSSSSKVEVKLERLNNINVKISLTNTGPETLRVVKLDGLLSDLDVNKIMVIREGNILPFSGITHVDIQIPALQDSAFELLSPSATVDVEFDIAHVYDLTAGGDVDLVSWGTLLHVASGSSVANKIPFASNTLTVNIDGAGVVATPWKSDFLLQDDCTADQIKTLEQARVLCYYRAWSAWEASHPDTANHAKMMEFFKDDSDEIRIQVSDGFYDIGMECDGLHDGFTKQYCNDRSDCPPGVQATTHVSSEELVIRYCPNYFDASYKTDNPTCHEADKTLVMMHELAHAMMFVDDVAYEYENFVKLNSTDNLNNADTYAFFAKAVQNGC
ncbi:hypothetical protein J4E91_004380 [Alternaria rosae]|nr:hypothetical protein J4E91_004380 [Alternaria rosae]